MIGVAIVPVNRRGRLSYFALVDPEDRGIVSRYRWTEHGPEAGSSYPSALADGRRVVMHRFILGLREGEGVVHHINEIKCDNRRSNLKLCADRREAAQQPHPKAWERIRQLSTEYQNALWRANNPQAEGI